MNIPESYSCLLECTSVALSSRAPVTRGHPAKFFPLDVSDHRLGLRLLHDGSAKLTNYE